jgi:hypothetical protein
MRGQVHGQIPTRGFIANSLVGHEIKTRVKRCNSLDSILTVTGERGKKQKRRSQTKMELKIKTAGIIVL